MFLEFLFFANNALISLTDLLDFEISSNPIILMLCLSVLIQLHKRSIDLMAIMIVLLVIICVRKYLQEADILIPIILSLTMTVDRLPIFFFSLGLSTLVSFAMGKLQRARRIPFVPQLLISHFISSIIS